MSVLLPKRRLIPRWRRISATLLQREAQPERRGDLSPIVSGQDDLARAIKQWRETPTAGYLGDILSFAVASDCANTVKDIAREALRQNRQATSPQKALMNSFLRGGGLEQGAKDTYGICNPHVQQRVRDIRVALRINPANPLVLLDFAQLQLASGHVERANRSLASALALSPNSRLVLRTVARFYAHTGAPDRAQSLLAKHVRSPSDPWLMASEVALSQMCNAPSRFAKSGMRAMKKETIASADISELAGALAGIELVSGNVKRARELFRTALLRPNDNVIAQAITDRKFLSLDLNQPAQRNVALDTVEARALLAWDGIKVEEALQNGLDWHAEEPFSSRPLQFLTSLLAATGDYLSVIALAKRGLVADSRDASLMANLSYALACQGNLEQAEIVANRAAVLDPKRVGAQSVATRGLIAMKRGVRESADELYAQALQMFKLSGESVLHAICYAYYARTAYEAKHPRFEEIVRHAIAAYEKAPSPDAALILMSLNTHISAPSQEEPTRRLEQWVFDPARLEIVRKRGLTEPGAPPLVIKGR